MADLTDIQAAQATKIIGCDSTGLETNPVNADSNGNLQVTVVQNELVSTNNSSIANLAAAATFTGTSDLAVGYGSVAITFKADQAATIQFEQSTDNSNWDHIESYTVAVNVSDIRTFKVAAKYLRVLVTNNGGSTTTVLRLQTILSPMPNAEFAGVTGTQAPTSAALISGQFTSASGLSSPLSTGQHGAIQVDSAGRLLTSSVSLPTTASKFSFGEVATSASTQVAVRFTAYTEQTTNAQRSIVSASVNDASAGTGARTVKITYLDSTGAGPFTETITLNGTTAVNTVSTTICFIEKIEVLTVGSTGSNVGILTLKAATAGGGATIGTVGATANQTFWAHHYAPLGKTSYITGLSIGNNASSAGAGSTVILKAANPTSVNNAEIQISDFTNVAGGSNTIVRTYGSPIQVPGPARITAYVTPLATSAYTTYASFDYIDN